MYLYIIAFMGFVAGCSLTALYLTRAKKMLGAGLADAAAKLEK